MKIAQVAPLYESVPPKLYGGTERVVSYLTDELVRQGHDVTLFASGDSNTKARLISCVSKALRLENVVDANIYNVLQLQQVIDMVSEFDILHYHTDYMHFPSSKICGWPHVTTLHGRLNINGLPQLYETFNDTALISISFSQRKPLARANWIGNVYHGLPKNLYKQGSGTGGYAAFIGRISPEKRVDRAIEITERAGMKLKIAAKIDQADQEYFNREIKHLFDKPHVEFIGEISEKDKGQFLGDAAVMLFPIDWPEPFGMVMIEAMACGTPVVAFGHGSVPEVLDNGKTGFIVSTIEEAINAITQIDRIDRDVCREVFEQRFTVQRMANDYCTLYKTLIDGTKQVRLPVKPESENQKLNRNSLTA